MRYRFSLFVSGSSPSAAGARRDLQTLCQRLSDGACDVEVVDVDLDPAAARDSDIAVVPTLIRRKPTPERRVLGELGDPDGLLRVLELDSDPPSGRRRVRGRS